MAHSLWFFLPLMATCLLTGQSLAKAEVLISVVQVTAVEIGENAEIQCSITNNETLQWYPGTNATAENPIPHDVSQRVHSNSSTGLLTIKNANKNDTGKYLCQTSSGNYSATAQINVYEMPSYFTLGMIILGINLGLLFIIAVCSIHICLKNRRKKKEDAKKIHKKTKTVI